MADESSVVFESSGKAKPRVSAVWRAKTTPGRQSLTRLVQGSPQVSVVIPALNEAKNLEHVLPGLPDGLFEVVVVDGGSSDATMETALRLRPEAHVVS